MYTVYVLKDKDGKFYKGMTSNMPRRLAEHKAGKTVTTKRMTELRVVYQECYETLPGARKRELYFKTAAGRRFLRKQPLPG